MFVTRKKKKKKKKKFKHDISICHEQIKETSVLSSNEFIM